MTILVIIALALLPFCIIALVQARSAEILHDKACFLCGVELDEQARARLKAVTWEKIFSSMIKD